MINSDKDGWGLVGDMFKGLVVGAAAGAAGAWAGGAISGALNFGGFAGGALSGGAGGAAGGFVGGAGNAWANGASLNEGLKAGIINGGIGAATGALFGGIIAGIDAVKSDTRFWNGRISEVGGYDGPGAFLNEEIPAGAKPTDLGYSAVTEDNLHYGEYGWTREYPNGDLKPHFGVDYYGDEYSDVFAMYDGTVIGNHSRSFIRAYGEYSVRTQSIINTKIYNVDYGHLSRNVLSIGQRISAGDLVGYMGRLGNLAGTSFPTHVHISIWRPLQGCPSMGFVRPHWY